MAGTVLDRYVRPGVTGAIASGAAAIAAEKSRELFEGVRRFAKTS